MVLKKIVIFIVSIAFFSCNDSDIGIFYGLETEEKLADNSLPNNVTVGGMVKNVNELYIAAGKIYTKTSGSDSDWDKLSTPSGYDLSTSIAVSNDNYVYAVFFNKESAEKALFRMQNGGSWSKVTDSDFSGSIELVKNDETNKTIFVSTRVSSNEGNLYYLDAGDFTPVPGITMTGCVFHVLYHDSNYWISNYNNLYRGADPSSLTELVTDLNINDEIRGLSPSSSDYIYFTYWDKDGTKGSIVAVNGSTIEEEGSDYSYMLNGLKIFTASGYNFLVCGTGGRGYYQILSPSSTNLDIKKPSNNVLSENYSSATDLQDSVVLDFFIDGGDDGDLYALTATRGLWKNSLSGGTRTWSIE